MCVAPVDPDVGMRGYQAAVGAVQHVQEAVLVGLDHHLAEPAVNLDIGQHVLVRAVHVVGVVGRVLVVADDLAGAGPHRDHAGRIEAVQLSARPRVPGRGIPGAPVDEVQLRIVRAGAPRGRPAELPRIGVRRPRLRPGLARRGNGVAAPQLRPGFRIPAVEKSARRGLAARHPRDEHAARHHRRARCVVPLAPLGELLLPQLFARLRVERDHVVVQRDAEQLALVEDRCAPVERGAARPLLEGDRRAPDLPAGVDVDGERPPPVDRVDHAVVHDRRGQLAEIVHQARAPDGHQPVNVGPVDSAPAGCSSCGRSPCCA